MKKIVSLLLTAVMLVGALSITASADTWVENGYTVIIASNVKYYYGPSTTGYDVVPGVTSTYGYEFGVLMPQLGLDGQYWASTGNGWLPLNGNVATYQATNLPFINGKVKNVSSHLNVRSAPTTNAPILYKLNNKDTVDVYAMSHDEQWLKIECNDGTVGWASIDYLEKDNGT